MMPLPLVFVHIVGAVVGVLAGVIAMAVRKGRGWHAAAGIVFAIAMFVMCSSAAYIAMFQRPDWGNAIAALLVIYLVATSWRAARVRVVGVDRVDVFAGAWTATIGVADIVVGLVAHGKLAPAVYFFFGTIALLFALSDFRVRVRGALTGTARIRRHLWRMSLALLIAMLSFYPGQARLFPKSIRNTNLLFVPHVLVAASTLLWMARTRQKRHVAFATLKEVSL